MNRKVKSYNGYNWNNVRKLWKVQNNNQGRGKCYQPKPKAEADNTYRDLDYTGYHKNRI